MGLVSRYESRPVFLNDHPAFEHFLRDKGVTFIRQYSSPDHAYPTTEQIQTLVLVSHMWRSHDRYDRLADKFYGDPEMWWVIAWFNKKPAEFLLKPGDKIVIPSPLEHVLEFFEV